MTAALSLILVGAASGAVGIWVLHFGRAILAESFAHALLPGLVLATLAGGSLLAGALAGAALAYGVLIAAERAPHTTSSAATSVSVTLLLGGGALLATAGGGIADFDALLFGDPLTAGWRDVAVAGGFALAALLALAVLGGRFSALAFDPASGPSLGISAARTQAAVIALLAVSVAIAANVSGNLLALALVTGPAFGAAALTRRVRSSLLLAAAAGAAGGLAGLLLARATGWPAGASVGLVVCLWAAAAAAAGGLRARSAPVG
jgi:manganese/iron transport system permease protein